MSATDILRTLLDERGVEWQDDSSIYGTRRTVWKVDGVTFVAAEVSGRLKVSGYLTPEQAIAATLGRGECHDEGGVDVNGQPVFCCDACGCVLSLWDSDGTNTLSTHYIYDCPRYCPACGRKVVDPTTNDVDAEVDDGQ